MDASVIIKANGNVIGTIQSISYTESLDTKIISGKCTKIRFDRERIVSAFSGGFVSHASQLLPFNIIIFEGLSDVTVIENFWISKINGTVTDCTVIEQMDWKAENIYKF